jgi:hypothetical protein
MGNALFRLGEKRRIQMVGIGNQAGPWSRFGLNADVGTCWMNHSMIFGNMLPFFYRLRFFFASRKS